MKIWQTHTHISWAKNGIVAIEHMISPPKLEKNTRVTRDFPCFLRPILSSHKTPHLPGRLRHRRDTRAEEREHSVGPVDLSLAHVTVHVGRRSLVWIVQFWMIYLQIIHFNDFRFETIYFGEPPAIYGNPQIAN